MNNDTTMYFFTAEPSSLLEFASPLNPNTATSPTPMKRRAGMDGSTRGGSGSVRAMKRNMKRRKEGGR